MSGNVTSDPLAEPALRVDTREELVYLLGQACEIEHGLMCEYLYAQFSLKRGPDEGLTDGQLARVQAWEKTLITVIKQEMRWPGASQRRSLKCSSEQMATAAAESMRAMAPLRMTSDGAGRGRLFLAALRSGAAPPITVASAITQPRYCATSQVKSSSCTNAHLTWPMLIGFSFTSLAILIWGWSRCVKIRAGAGWGGWGPPTRAHFRWEIFGLA
jgi:hypothetical protein